jgi:hypothetical protein
MDHSTTPMRVIPAEQAGLRPARESRNPVNYALRVTRRLWRTGSRLSCVRKIVLTPPPKVYGALRAICAPDPSAAHVDGRHARLAIGGLVQHVLRCREFAPPGSLSYDPRGYIYRAAGRACLRIFATKVFARFARKERLDDTRLSVAITRAESGSIDVNLGGSLIKQRVARQGGGRSGGYRTVIAYRASQRSAFLYGFAKSERDNIDARELNDLKKLARHYLGYSESQIATALERTELREVMCDVEKEG